jgi:hypothetical protein
MCFSKTVYIITSQFNEKRIHRRSEQIPGSKRKKKTESNRTGDDCSATGRNRRGDVRGTSDGSGDEHEKIRENPHPKAVRKSSRVKVTKGRDKNRTRIKPGDTVHVERGKYKGREYIIDSFSSKDRCRLQVGGGNATTLVVKTTQVRQLRRGSI